MGDKITHRQHKWILTFVVLIATVLGMVFATTLIGRYQGYDELLMLMFGMLLTVVILLVILVAIVVKMEEDFYWHHKKL